MNKSWGILFLCQQPLGINFSENVALTTLTITHYFAKTLSSALGPSALAVGPRLAVSTAPLGPLG